MQCPEGGRGALSPRPPSHWRQLPSSGNTTRPRKLIMVSRTGAVCRLFVARIRAPHGRRFVVVMAALVAVLVSLSVTGCTNGDAEATGTGLADTSASDDTTARRGHVSLPATQQPTTTQHPMTTPSRKRPMTVPPTEVMAQDRVIYRRQERPLGPGIRRSASNPGPRRQQWELSPDVGLASTPQ